jgi:ABC-2 type transport system ATP-binding protein
MIEFCNISRRYGQKVAVAELNLTVQPGELFALLGPNGAGKTTTIKMLVGQLWPDSGMVRVCGFDLVKQTREAAWRIGYVPDEPFLYDKLSGREFLEFAGEMRGLERSSVRNRISIYCDQFELGGFVDTLIETYSHGMRQRLVLASALLHDPAILVIDEPTVALDPRSVRLVKDILISRAAAGTTVFMSTHVLNIAEEIASRIGIVDQGHLRYLGTVGDLRTELSSPHTSLERLFLQLTDGEEKGNGKQRPGNGESDK